MPARKNVMSNQTWYEWIIDALTKIKLSRQRATFVRICQAVRKRHIFHEETIAAKLQDAEKSGLIGAALVRGELTYRMLRSASKQIRSGNRSRKWCPVPDVLCIECLRTSVKGPNHQPEPMSSCERCGISMHDSCSNKSSDRDTTVPLSQLVSAGNHWFCEECKSCAVCHSANESLSRARRCLVQCADCGGMHHFECMEPALAAERPQKLPWRCSSCCRNDTPVARKHHGKYLRSSQSPLETEISRPEIGVMVKRKRGRSETKLRAYPTEAELLDGRIEAMRIKLADRVTTDDLDMFKMVLQRKCALQEDDLKRTPSAIRFGKHEIESWYSSPFPQEYAKLKLLYMCEFCLKYLKTNNELGRHQKKCLLRHPPGNEIYRDGALSVFEVDGNCQKLYCQSLCLLAKLFLDHKTLYFDVEPFLFYILTKYDNLGHHIVGYFSKEKINHLNYNVSCILTMPQYQRQGYGRLLIEFSYLLSRVENTPGTPERPLSDLGRLSYHQYWCSTLLSYLTFNRCGALRLASISRDTGMVVVDIVTALRMLGFIKYRIDKVGSVRTIRPILCIDWQLVDRQQARMNRSKDRVQLHEMCLRWTPVLNRTAVVKAAISGPLICQETPHEMDDVDSEAITPIKLIDHEQHVLGASEGMVAAASSPDENSRTTEQSIVTESPSEENSKYTIGTEDVARTNSGRKRLRTRKYSEAIFDLSLTTGTPRKSRQIKLSPGDVNDPCLASVDSNSRSTTGCRTEEEISLDSVEAFMGTPKSELYKSPTAYQAHGFTPIAPFRHPPSGGNGTCESSSTPGDGLKRQEAPIISTPTGRRTRFLGTGSPSKAGRAISNHRKRTLARLQDPAGCKRQRLQWPGSEVHRDAFNGRIAPTQGQPQVTLLHFCRPTRLGDRGRASEGSISKFNGSNVGALPQTV